MNFLIEAVLTFATLAGYFMVLNGIMYYGAMVAAIANIFNIMYGANKKAPNLIIINAVMLIINISFLMK